MNGMKDILSQVRAHRSASHHEHANAAPPSSTLAASQHALETLVNKQPEAAPQPIGTNIDINA